MNRNQIQCSEGSQTTKLVAPADVSPGQIYTYFGVPLVAHSLAKAGEESVFYKRATLRIPARKFGMQSAPPAGPLYFSTVPMARQGWERFAAWGTEGDVQLGVVERRIAGSRPVLDTFVLSMCDGVGMSSSSSGGSYDEQIEQLRSADESQVAATEVERGRNDDQDAEIVAIKLSATSVGARVTTLEDLITGGGEGPNLEGLQDQIDDLETQTSQLASDDAAQRARIAAIEAGGQVSILNVVQLNAAKTEIVEVTTIAPQETKVLRLTPQAVPQQQITNNGYAPGTPQANFSPNEFVLVNGQPVGDRISFPRPGVYDIILQLAPQTDATGENAGQPYYAGNAMSVTIRKYDQAGNEQVQPLRPNFPGRLAQAAGYWPSQRLQTTILVRDEGESIDIQVGNTNSGDLGDDQPVLLGPSAVVLASFRGRL